MRLGHVFRQLLFWGIPIVAVFLLLISGFVYWLVGTPTGTRWAMNTAALHFEGESRGVKGSFWHGLEFDHLSLALPDDMHIGVDDARIEIDWMQLWHSRQLRIKDLSAQHVSVILEGEAKPKDPDAAPFQMPELPVTVQIDHLAVGNLSVSLYGEPLPVDLSQLNLQAKGVLNNDGAQIQLASARVGYEDMWLDTDGTLQLHQFAPPWNSEVKLNTRASSDNPASSLCLEQYLPDHLKSTGPELRDPLAPHCALTAEVNWQGSLEQALLTVRGAGQGLDLDVTAQLELSLDAEGIPNNEGAKINLTSARVGYKDMWLDADGTLQLHQFEPPWNSEVQLNARAYSNNLTSPLCLDQYLPDHLQFTGPELPDPLATHCAVTVEANWQGSLDQALLTVTGAGQGLELDARAQLELSHAFPVRDTSVKMALPDGSQVDLALNWDRDAEQPSIDRLSGSIMAHEFNAGAWIPDMDLPAELTLSGHYSAELSDFTQQLDQAQVDLQIDESSRWNGQKLKGHVMAEVARLDEADVPQLWQAYTVKNSDIDVQVGTNHIQLKGAFGLAKDTLKLLIDLPAIQQLWPNLDEIGATKLEAEVHGSVFEHELTADLQHMLKNKDAKAKVGNGMLDAKLAIKGVLDINSDTPSWRGQIQHLNAEHAGLAAAIEQAFDVEVLLPKANQAFAADIGAFTLQALVDKKPWLKIYHEHSHVDEEGFSTKGKSDAVNISAERISDIMLRLGIEEEPDNRRDIVDNRDHSLSVKDLVLQLDWDIALKDALAGKVHLQRLSGDIMVPAEPPFPLGLEQTELTVNIVPGAGGRSMIEADLLIQTDKMGYVKANATTPIYYSKDKGIEVRDADHKEIVVDAHMDDLAWTSLILKDQLELGGELVADMRIHSTPDGEFVTEGEITGHHLKVTRLDDGVRLLGGELKANLNNNRFTVERLHFPAQLRVEPKEWRTATWISENPDAQGGYLDITGFWNLEENTGNFDVDLYRYPILQRADRYAMISGELHMRAAMPQINLTGKVTADAGWFNLDMLGGIPTIDGDVVVIRSTDPVKEKKEEVSAPLDINMNLEVDLGPRFYLTGYGVNSGLIGQLNIHMIDGQLTALGALNTRGGAIEMYGQRLQLRRGTITFQGDIANPVLDIQALRTGLSVEAGVKVGGTARKPKINLISVPDVSELEKLSWLLFGHGPDDGGGDLALLVSVGSSFLGDGEPFYRKFGIDELSVRSGELGGAGSVLPATSVASSRESDVSNIEQRFIQATKTLSEDITVGVRQALSDTGTVGRATYKLTRRLTAELSIGTVSGLALVYRWFSKD